MGWSIGYDSTWDRDIGYGVPAYCDYPGCSEEIDRGLAYVCGGEQYGGDISCGLYFCSKHRDVDNLCERCACDPVNDPFEPSKDHPEWVKWKLTDESWKEWREANPEQVKQLNEDLGSK